MAASAAGFLVALPPTGIWVAGLFALLPMFALVQRCSALGAGVAGLVLGITTGAAVYAGAAVMDAATWLGASALVGVGMGVFFLCTARLSRIPLWQGAPLVAALWACIEQAFAAAGLPFTLALTLSSAPTLLQSAAIGGQWLVVFLLVLVQFAVARARVMPSERQVAGAWLIAAAALTGLGALHSPAQSGTVHVAAVQTRLHPFDYVHAEADGQLAKLAAVRNDLAAQARTAKPDLLVWPEVPFARFEARSPAAAWPLPGAAQLIAGNDLAPSGRQYNAVFGVTRDGAVVSRHVKSVLLPRLEDKYSAVPDIAAHSPLPGAPGSLVCFESAFPGVARRLAVDGAAILAISTSDAFAGPSALPWLHAAYAPLRAVENRRSVVRAANGGPSLIVGPDGRRIAALGLFDQGIVAAQVPTVTGLTFFARHDGAVRTLLLMLLLPALPLIVRTPPLEHAQVRLHAMSVGAPVIVGCVYVAATAWLASAAFVRETGHTPGWAGFGFTQHRAFSVDYDELRSLGEPTDIDASVAALLRRFGQDATRASVARTRAALELQSAFRIDVAALLNHYGLAHQPMSLQRMDSDIPCIATLVDRTSVLVARRSAQAVEVFSPAQASVLSLPRRWLDERATPQSRCVIGRAFPWDLGRE